MNLLSAVLFFCVIVQIQCMSGYAHAATIQWNTFLGGTTADESLGVVHDNSGNIYVTGYSYGTWGTPIRAWSGHTDAFVAKLNSSGVLQWNTFLGSDNNDTATDIAIDSSGNIYVTGYSNTSWGTPIHAHSSDAPHMDAFVAKLNPSGTLIWHTFMGGADLDFGAAVSVDKSGNIYIAGNSENSWGTPVTAHGNTGWGGFVAKLNNSGILQWNTFIEPAVYSNCTAIAATDSGTVYVAGETGSTWGNPIAAYSGDRDGFLAEYNTAGVRQWNTFFGSAESDTVTAMTTGNSGIYITGESDDSWGTPVSPHSVQYNIDVYAVRFSTSGEKIWNTFMGSRVETDFGSGISLDSAANIYVTGTSSGPWGNGAASYSGDDDIFVNRLNSAGQGQGNVFLGSEDSDSGNDITVEQSGKVIVVGTSHNSWGTPIRPHGQEAGYNDGFAVKLELVAQPSPAATSCTFVVIPLPGGKAVTICL